MNSHQRRKEERLRKAMIEYIDKNAPPTNPPPPSKGFLGARERSSRFDGISPEEDEAVRKWTRTDPGFLNRLARFRSPKLKRILLEGW